MDALLQRISQLVDDVTGKREGGRDAAGSPGGQLPVVRIAVLGGNQVGKTTLVEVNRERKAWRSMAGAEVPPPTRRATACEVILEQRERKWFPLTPEFALSHSMAGAGTQRGRWRKGEGLRFVLQLWEVPYVEVQEDLGMLHGLLDGSHGCLFVADSSNLGPSLKAIEEWAVACDKVWRGLEVPRALALHKMDLRQPVDHEAVAVCGRLCGAKRVERTAGTSAGALDAIDRLLDDILEAEVERLGSDECQVDWLVGQRAETKAQQMGEETEEEEESPRHVPGWAGGRQQDASPTARHMPEMFFANARKPTSRSSFEESVMPGWGEAEASQVPVANATEEAEREKGNMKELRRLLKSITRYYDGVESQLRVLVKQAAPERKEELLMHLRRRTEEKTTLLTFLDACSLSGDSSSSSSSEAGMHLTGEALSLDDVTRQLGENQLKWNRLLEAYETEVMLLQCRGSSSPSASASASDQFAGFDAVIAAAGPAGSSGRLASPMRERSCESPSVARRGFTFRQIGTPRSPSQPVPTLPLVSTEAEPRIMKDRRDSL